MKRSEIKFEINKRKNDEISGARRGFSQNHATYYNKNLKIKI